MGRGIVCVWERVNGYGRGRRVRARIGSMGWRREWVWDVGAGGIGSRSGSGEVNAGGDGAGVCDVCFVDAW